MTRTYWTFHDEDTGNERVLTALDLCRMYDKEIDHYEYPTYGGWVWDMERHGVMNRYTDGIYDATALHGLEVNHA